MGSEQQTFDFSARAPAAAPSPGRADALRETARAAEQLNRLLREANVKDEYRPAYVGALVLAARTDRAALRVPAPELAAEVNRINAEVFAGIGKAALAPHLRLAAGDARLGEAAAEALALLDALGVPDPATDHDTLGQLYETFFRYTGGNTIGQYFTPRHVVRFMAQVCAVGPADRVVDVACGTGGFLLAARRAERLYGFESEPVTAALCVVNLLIRGAPTEHVHLADGLSSPELPLEGCTVALLNPPFPHRSTDRPPQDFVDRALDALAPGGRLAAILPSSILSRSPNAAWRERTLARSRLRAVVELPDELFQPYASATTSVILLEKGAEDARPTTAVRVHYDGLTLSKGVRVPRSDGRDDLPAAREAVISGISRPGRSGPASISGKAEWSAGAHIPSAVPTEDELAEAVDELLRRLASFYVRYAREVASQRAAIASGELPVAPYPELLSPARRANARRLGTSPGTLGATFDIYYGMKELHSRGGIPPGESLVISPTEAYNGCYGWLAFQPLIEPPFLTVAQTGSIGEAFVQLEPCAVNDDCLLLIPRDPELPLAALFVAAAVIRLERWRFSYGRKLTPARVARFAFARLPDLEARIGVWLDGWRDAWEPAVARYAAESAPS